MSFKKSLLVKGILFSLLAISLFLTQFIMDLSSYFDPEKIHAWLRDSGSFAPVLHMLFMAAAVVISPVPSLALDIAAGGFFGPLLRTTYSSVGALGGATVSFMIARLLGGELLKSFYAVVSFDIISYGAGLTKMSLRNFVLATFFGMLPLTFVYNYFGSV